MKQYLLSLAITETRRETNEFNVIAMDTATYKMVPLKLQKHEIVTPSGEILWDLGRITEVGKIKKDPSLTPGTKNIVYLPGDCRLTDEKVDLRSILEENTTDINEFFKSITSRFAIVKADYVKDLYIDLKDYPNLKHRIRVIIQDRPAELFLNKDYRWVNYWQWQYEKGNTDSLKENYIRYVNLLNTPGKSLYLILYRHFFPSKSETWIAGMHWL